MAAAAVVDGGRRAVAGREHAVDGGQWVAGGGSLDPENSNPMVSRVGIKVLN